VKARWAGIAIGCAFVFGWVCHMNGGRAEATAAGVVIGHQLGECDVIIAVQHAHPDSEWSQSADVKSTVDACIKFAAEQATETKGRP
jgi:hypothetical protein